MPQCFEHAYSPPCITARRGGRAINKMSRSLLDREAGVVFRFRTKGKPPRLRLLRWLREILLMTQPPLLAVMQGGEYACSKHWGIFFTAPISARDSLLLKFNVIHCINALTPSQPSGGGQRAQSKPAAVLGDVSKLNKIRFGVESNSMCTGNQTCTRGRNMQHLGIDFSMGRPGEDFLFPIDPANEYPGQGECRGAGTIDLLTVMDFLNVWIVFRCPVQQLRSSFHDTEENIHSQRKIRRVQESRFFHSIPDFRQMLIPSRCTH